MTLLYDWVTNIILFILIATIIELLLPSNQFKKYVHFVFGLLFLLLLAQPLFYFFNTNMTEHISFVEQQMQVDNRQQDQTALQIDQQKEDIQAEQVAYIWNESAEYLKEEANDSLKERYNIQINDVQFHQTEQSENLLLRVTLGEAKELSEGHVQSIEPIRIVQHEEASTEQALKHRESILQFLRETWKLEETVTIELHWEGGRGD